MPTDIHALFTMLESKQLRYVVVDGLALVLHGVDRLTADVDLAVDLAPEAARQLVDALAESGYRPAVPVDARRSTFSLRHRFRLKSCGRMQSGSTSRIDCVFRLRPLRTLFVSKRSQGGRRILPTSNACANYEQHC